MSNMKHFAVLAVCLALSACHKDAAQDDPRTAKVPEPSALGVLLVGVIATGMAMRRRK